MEPQELKDFLRMVGGRQEMRSAIADPDDPASYRWNFGLIFRTLSGPTVTQAAPQIVGAWDGNTAVSHWEVTRKVLGDYLPAQRQTMGTCGGRATSGAGNVLQCLQIASGKPFQYYPISHAWCYVGARTLDGSRGRGGEGVMPPTPVEWCQKYGVVHQQESGDTDYDSEDVVRKWERSGIPRDVGELGKDNPFTQTAVCSSAQEAADVIASGGVIAVASDQGFTMTRDSEGVCSPQGTWMHYMYFAAVMKTPRGRKVFGCGQSWGKNTPNGPLLPGCPDYVFGVEWGTADRMLRQRGSTAITAFSGWQAPDFLIPWSFV